MIRCKSSIFVGLLAANGILCREMGAEPNRVSHVYYLHRGDFLHSHFPPLSLVVTTLQYLANRLTYTRESKMSRITFRKVIRPFELPHYGIYRGGKHVGWISISDGRYYWYCVNRGREAPHNTLCIPNSAVTLDGCKDEIREFFKN